MLIFHKTVVSRPQKYHIQCVWKSPTEQISKMSGFVLSKEDAQWLTINWKPGYSSAYALMWCLYTTEDYLTRNDKYWHTI